MECSRQLLTEPCTVRCFKGCAIRVLDRGVTRCHPPLALQKTPKPGIQANHTRVKDVRIKYTDTPMKKERYAFGCHSARELHNGHFSAGTARLLSVQAVACGSKAIVAHPAGHVLSSLVARMSTQIMYKVYIQFPTVLSWAQLYTSAIAPCATRRRRSEPSCT